MAILTVDGRRPGPREHFMALAGGSWVGAAAAELSGRAGTRGRDWAMADGANSRVLKYPLVPTPQGGDDAT